VLAALLDRADDGISRPSDMMVVVLLRLNFVSLSLDPERSAAGRLKRKLWLALASPATTMVVGALALLGGIMVASTRILGPR
jgi:hypothetical protein